MDISDLSQKQMEKAARDKALSDAYVNCFSTPDGKVVLADIADRVNLFTSSFDENPHTMAYHEGWRALFLYILERIDHQNRNPLVRFQRMMGEYKDRQDSIHAQHS